MLIEIVCCKYASEVLHLPQRRFMRSPISRCAPAKTRQRFLARCVGAEQHRSISPYVDMGCSLVAILDLKGKVRIHCCSIPLLLSCSATFLLVPRHERCANPDLSLACQSLIQRSYRDDIPASTVEKFLPLILDLEEEGTFVTPCFSSEGINYLHIRHNNLYRTFCFPVPLSLREAND